MLQKRVFVAGANGYIGRHFVVEALKRGLGVTGLITDINKSKFIKHKDLILVEGSVLDESCVKFHIAGANYILSAIDDQDDLGAFLPDFRYLGTLNLIKAAKVHQVQRTIAILGASILKFSDGNMLYDETDAIADFQSKDSDIQKEETKKMWETWRLLERSGINWTGYCPALVTDRERTGDYRLSLDSIEDVTMGDLVEAILKEFEKEQHNGKLIGIKTVKEHANVFDRNVKIQTFYH